MARTTENLFEISKNGNFQIHNGDWWVSPVLARETLEITQFEGQRRTEEVYVGAHVRMIDADVFLPRSPIAFCRIGNRYYLVNGKHRLTAVARANRSILFSVTVYPCETMEEVRDIYSRFDSVQRTRTLANIVSAFDISEKYGLPKELASAFYRTIPLLVNNLQVMNYQKEEVADLRSEMAVPAFRMVALQEWAPYARRYSEAISGTSDILRRRLLSSHVLAVGLYTLRYCPEKAFEFFKGLADDDGLRKGDPRKTLSDVLKTKDNMQNKVQNVMWVGLAWNAFYRGQDLAYIRATKDTELRLLGTPLEKKARVILRVGDNPQLED